MTRKFAVLAVAALGVLAAGGSSVARAGDDGSTQPESQRLVWRTSRGGDSAEARSLSMVTDPKGDSVVMGRDLIVTPAGGRLVLTETSYMRRGLTRIRLRDEQTGWWVQLETATGQDFGSFDHMSRQSVEDVKKEEAQKRQAEERQADPGRTYALTGTGGLSFSTRVKARDTDGSVERAVVLAMSQAIAQSHVLDGASASPVGEELVFLRTLWRQPDDVPPLREVVQLLVALNATLSTTPTLEQAIKGYTDGSWTKTTARLADGFSGGQDKAAADAFIRTFKSVSPGNPLVDAAQ